MPSIVNIFERIHHLIHEEIHPDVVSSLLKIGLNLSENQSQQGNIKVPTFEFLLKIYQEIDSLRSELEKDDKILISVRDQKLLRTCFQLVASLGFSPCLIPGLGISLSKRCSTASLLPPSTLSEEQKYEMLVACTDFFTRSYAVPALKNIIITFHLSDYLAALIQLSFAPLKKPGSYTNFTMTQEMHQKLSLDHTKYIQVYENLVANCFQPILMKELLVLQAVTEPSPPAFVKRVISKEMSRRLLTPGGLLSLIRCFLETYTIDTGSEWQKIDMICKIVSAQHGSDSLDSYLNNICSQLMQIFASNNSHYLIATVACLLSLNEKHPHSDSVESLMSETFQSLDYDQLSKSNLPGTIILPPQGVEHNVNVLHALSLTKLHWPVSLVTPNLYTLFLLGLKCTKNEDLRTKIEDALLKFLKTLDKDTVTEVMTLFLFGKSDSGTQTVVIEEYEAGLAIKCRITPEKQSMSESVSYFLNLFNKTSNDGEFVKNVFQGSLKILIDLNEKRNRNSETKQVFKEDNNELFLNDSDEQYATILQFLSEISESPKVVNSLKSDPTIVLDFLEYLLLKTRTNHSDDCLTIALVLLNTVLSNCQTTKDLLQRLGNLVPVLKRMAENESDLNSILCKEVLSLISSDAPRKPESKCDKAISDVYDRLLPVRAHGIMDLTKLIDANDPETLSKKHYIFCLFQEHLKDTDSYIYLSAINGLASLGTHCTEDVIQVLCKEFLQVSTDCQEIQTNDGQNKITELRMKIGDVIVKVTKRLGEMAVVHKTVLLNTMLCGCRDDDPFIRMSALSNLAEIAQVLHYKMGSIIYEVLLCTWSILESDKAVECRRAAVMVITSLLKGLGKDTLVQLKENLLPIYRALKKLYRNENEDSVVRLHAQLALEQLNDAVNEFLFPVLKLEKPMFVLNRPDDEFK